MTPAAQAAQYASFAIPRPGRVDEVAKLALFLASDDSTYCTGAEFIIDGGMLAGMVNPHVRPVAPEHLPD
jgi:NAD(P)-dependent dehydrogenase (short-subunit alcohol dehydrogenase family)